jgi:beta-mannosidase
MQRRLRDVKMNWSSQFASAALYARAMRDQLGDLPNTYPDFEQFSISYARWRCTSAGIGAETLITAGIGNQSRGRDIEHRAYTSVRLMLRRRQNKAASVEVFVETGAAVASTLKCVPNSPHAGKTIEYTHCCRGFRHRRRVALRGKKPRFVVAARSRRTAALRLAASGGMPRVTRLAAMGIAHRFARSGHEHRSDEVGEQWTIEINGKPIWIKGANWIPDDCFPHRVDEARYRERIIQAIDSNMNLLRIWGGGTYESETFYSICDELGVLVWQDFPVRLRLLPRKKRPSISWSKQRRATTSRDFRSTPAW